MSGDTNGKSCFKYTVNENGVVITKYYGDKKCVVIPQFIDGKQVIEIARHCFLANKSVERIVIPEGVTKINYGAFDRCTNLKRLEVPSTIMELEESEHCHNLILNEYENALYLGNESKPYIVLVDVTKRDCESFKIHEDTKIICPHSFEFCSHLTELDIPKGVKRIGIFAFQDCTHLESITLPEGITSIEDCTFYRCRSLKKLDIPSGVIKIGRGAFSTCQHLESVFIPKSVSNIGKDAFLCSMFSPCADLTIYCEAQEKPEGWEDNWNGDCKNVVWEAQIGKR